jgi:Protein of unknown function (DUF4058)
VPLREETPEPIADLQTVWNETYQRGRLALLIDYASEPIPKVSQRDRQWIEALKIESPCK